MTYRLPIGETPFNLAFRIEAAISLELGSPSYKIKSYGEHWNSEDLRTNLYVLEEV